MCVAKTLNDFDVKQQFYHNADKNNYTHTHCVHTNILFVRNREPIHFRIEFFLLLKIKSPLSGIILLNLDRETSWL